MNRGRSADWFSVILWAMVPLLGVIRDMLVQPAAVWYAAGYAVGVIAFYLMARHRRFPFDSLAGLCLSGLLGGLIGAGIAQWVVSGNLGKSVLGGVLFGWAAVVVYKRMTGFQRPTGDLFAVGLTMGEAVGRLGCFVGGCCYGLPTQCAWGVYQHGMWRHPTQLYLSVSCALILAILLWCESRRPLPANGLWAIQGILYCIARFTIEFFRDHNPVGLARPEAASVFSTAQWVTLFGIIFFSGYLIRLFRGPQGATVVTA